MSNTLITIECSRPGDPYSLFKSGTNFDVHLAGPSKYGTGPCLCGFDRFAKDVGFSVGGGYSGPGYIHHPCPDCAALAGGRTVNGTHRDLFTTTEPLPVNVYPVFRQAGE